jgi:hypothetical protein
MAPTAAFCRTQEAAQRARAAAADLENVKAIALSAATAWAREAALAEKRENGRLAAGALPDAGSLSERVEDQAIA